MDDEPLNSGIPEEIPMEEKRRGVEHEADILDSGHSRSVERRTVENVMEDSYLRYSMSVIWARWTATRRPLIVTRRPRWPGWPTSYWLISIRKRSITVKTMMAPLPNRQSCRPSCQTCC